MSIDHPLKYKTCPKCGGIAEEVVHAQSKTRLGWYCPTCKVMEDKAIGRERKA